MELGGFKMILENISGPKDLKGLTIEELHTLVDETRTALLEKISVHGGHSGPNLGMVEMQLPYTMYLTRQLIR